MGASSTDKPYDVEERTAAFAGDVALFCNHIVPTLSNSEHCTQAIRSSGSMAANYIYEVSEKCPFTVIPGIKVI
jgi:hypothetical protein